MTVGINTQILQKTVMFFKTYNISTNTLYIGEQEAFDLYNLLFNMYMFNDKKLSFSEFCNSEDLQYSGHRIVFVKNKNYLEVGI